MLGTPLSSRCWKYLIALEFQGRKIEGNRECPANAISYDPTNWGRYLRGVPFFSVRYTKSQSANLRYCFLRITPTPMLLR